MKFSLATVLAAVAGAQAWSNVTYVTEVVTAVTTVCPEPTEFVYGGTTYTVTEVRNYIGDDGQGAGGGARLGPQRKAVTRGGRERQDG